MKSTTQRCNPEHHQGQNFQADHGCEYDEAAACICPEHDWRRLSDLHHAGLYKVGENKGGRFAALRHETERSSRNEHASGVTTGFGYQTLERTAGDFLQVRAGIVNTDQKYSDAPKHKSGKLYGRLT